MSDPDQRGEELDESVGDDFPPDRPPGLDDDGGTVPEGWERAGDDAEAVELVGDPDVGAVDDEGRLVGTVVDTGGHGPLAPDDEFSGDETTRDIAPERTPPPAEESAIHIVDE